MPLSLFVALSLLAAAPTPVDRNSAIAVANTAAGRVVSMTLTFDPNHLVSDAKQGFELSGLNSRGFQAGRRILPDFVLKHDPTWANNDGSAEFDGVNSLFKIGPAESHTPCFTTGSFTWEGFFFSPSTAVLKTDGAIGDRLISQFRDDKLNSTRLAIGLGRAKKDAPASLCVSLVGAETRYMGKLPVSQDAWHHFAVVYEAPSEAEAKKLREAGEAAAKSQPANGTERVVNVGGKLSWYLDYQPCGAITFDGKTDRTTLAPLGKSPLVIGGRNFLPGKDGAEPKVDRGFRGLLDEFRISAQALPVAEFLRLENKTPQRLVQAELFHPVAESLDLASFLNPLDARAPAAKIPQATETIEQETLGLAGLPTAFAMGGYVEPRRGRHVVRTTYKQDLKPGRYRLFVRTQSDALVELDGRTVLDARRGDDSALATSLGPIAGGSARDYRYDFRSSGGPHDFRLAALIDYGGTSANVDVADTKPVAAAAATAPSPVAKDEVIVGLARIDEATGREIEVRLLGGAGEIALDNYAWRASRGRDVVYWATTNEARKLLAVERREEFWNRRHAWAKTEAAKWPAHKPFSLREKVAVRPDEGRPANQPNARSQGNLPLTPALSREGEGVAINPIDSFLAAKLKQLNAEPAPLVDDATFLRRATLDFAGRNPTWREAEAFFADASADKRAKLVDLLLASPDWADSWVGYWQDLLAENPSILKPTLNNSGPFRRWIHESFAANKPLDRFAAELMLMQGSDEHGGTAGFAIASGNAMPMAMKGHVVAQAFLGIDMKCARCHDGPNAPFAQSDLFGLAAMLDERPVTVDLASTVVVPEGGRKPAVTSTLKVGDKVAPQWPLEQMIPTAAGDAGVSLVELADRPRARLASIIVSPTSTRFSDVAVNRIWQRYFGQGIIDPVDHWLDASEGSHPELLAYLSREFVVSGYDVKALVRLIAGSQAYQRAATGEATSYRDQRTFGAQIRRRMAAEQVVDSLFLTVGKSMNAEELNFDPNGTQGFLILPTPEKSWQFASLANERDRPALALPTNQMILDVLTTFGWRETRIDPWTRQDAEVNPLQPLMMANSEAVNQAIRLTEESAATAWCLEDLKVEQLVDRLFLATLARKPSDGERKLAVSALADSFAKRKTGKPRPAPIVRVRAHVDWDKHLKGGASTELLEAEKQARAGDPPTVRLTAEFRAAAEDVLWSLVNSPEFVFVP